jgi:hypothetical protein
MHDKQAVLGYIPGARLPDTTHRRLLMLRHCDSALSRKPQSAARTTVKLEYTLVVAMRRWIGVRSRLQCRCSRVVSTTGAWQRVQVTTTAMQSECTECTQKTNRDIGVVYGF